MILVGKAEGKRPLARPSNIWENYNNNMMIQEVGCGLGVDGAGSVEGGVGGHLGMR